MLGQVGQTEVESMAGRLGARFHLLGFVMILPFAARFFVAKDLCCIILPIA
jgi:hypothetical protein